MFTLQFQLKGIRERERERERERYGRKKTKISWKTQRRKKSTMKKVVKEGGEGKEGRRREEGKVERR